MNSTPNLAHNIVSGEVPYKYRHLFLRILLDLFNCESFKRAMLYQALKGQHSNAVQVVMTQFKCSRATVFRDHKKYKHLLDSIKK